MLAGIGGNHSNQLLPLLDFDLIRAHPKVFQGYSDMTVLHWAIATRAGLATFYGPALVPGARGVPSSPAATRTGTCAPRGSATRAISPSSPPPTWTDEFLDWDAKADLSRPRVERASEGWISIRDGLTSGPLLGGCLETICWHLKGSSAWVDPEGAILFLETSEDAPSPAPSTRT